MNSNLKKLNKFIKKLRQAGVLDWVDDLQQAYPKAEIYLVGGAVRDALLSKKYIKTINLAHKDLDFVVRHVPMINLEIFLSKLGWVELLGKNFGVLKFKPRKFLNNKNFKLLDIALPRSEFSFGTGAYRDFEVNFDEKMPLEQDLMRRDFTINALAVRLDKQIKIIDKFSGLADLQNKTIKCIDDAEERLTEDYTRILRAVRFACQLDFKIDSATQKAIKILAAHLNDKNKQHNFIAPREVIAKEFLKAFFEDPVKAFDLYTNLDLFKVLIPEILAMQKCPQPKEYHSEGDVWQHTRLALKNLNSKKFKTFSQKIDRILPDQDYESPIVEKLELILGLLLHDIGKPSTIKIPKKNQKDRIRFNDHDCVGADLTKKICSRLKLSAPEKIGIDCDNLAWLVRKHMMLVHGHPSEFRATTVEKNFFNKNYPGANLIKLTWLDISATHPKDYKLKPDLVFALLKRIKQMKKTVKQKNKKQALPQPFLDGNQIMHILDIPASKKVGEIKDKLREKQFSGEIKNKTQAKEFVKKNL